MEHEQYHSLLTHLVGLGESVTELKVNTSRLEERVQHLPTQQAIVQAIRQHMEQCQGDGSSKTRKAIVWDQALVFKLLTLLLAALCAALGVKIY